MQDERLEDTLDPAPRTTEATPRPRLAWLDRIGFLAGASLIVPYAGWVFIMERDMFTRLPLVLVTVLFFLGLQVYFFGVRDWLWGPKTRRVRIALALPVLGLGLMSLLVVPSVLLCIGVCELVYRLTPKRRGLDRLSGRGAQLTVTAFVGLVLFPAMNAMYWMHGGLTDLSPLLLMQNPLYEINADGFRGPLLRREKEPGFVRLLFLGDSTTFGWPYRYEESYPALVRKGLVERGRGPVEVINAGIVNQNIVQIRDRLERQLEYDPDLVFLMDGYHFDKTLDHFERPRENTAHDDDHAFRLRFYPPALLELGTLGVMSNPILTVFRRRDPLAERKHAAKNERVAAEQLAGLARVLRARGIPLILLEYPSRKVPAALREQHRREAAWTDGVSVLPLLHLFPGDTSYSFHDGIHPDKAGHRRIAGAIVDNLLERSWPPRRVRAGERKSHRNQRPRAQ